jgi:hypothetical protein
VTVAVAVVATGGCEARGGWWSRLSVPKPPKGVDVVDGRASGHGHGHDQVYDHDPPRLSRDYGPCWRLVTDIWRVIRNTLSACTIG